MPFGTTVLVDGTRFRLWAPAARNVVVCIEDHRPPIERPMQKQDGGWFDLTVPEAHSGSLYRFCIDGGQKVPDPASRWNPQGVHAASVVVDPGTYDWADDLWTGRPWHETVLYELHVGTFSPTGDFAGVRSRLDELARTGITAIELMPVGAFPGDRNWGYDGVLPFAPAASYGTPDDLKRLIDAAHARGLMVLLDVVYNHFGPDGNYLALYAPQFFTPRYATPWGAAINFEDHQVPWVREFFVHNALYWLEEFRFDGLRLDAVHAIFDRSDPHFLVELARAVRSGPGRSRNIHLVLENDDNRASLLETGGFNAQWNDDAHHCMHVLTTGERDGYYADYFPRTRARLGRALAEGFVYQGEPSPHRGHRRGEPSIRLAASAFINFLQNHDQIGNRALGDRLVHAAHRERLRALLEILLLAPATPMLFMGEEWGATAPFPFFCDFQAPLREAVTCGRREEFKRFRQFADPAARRLIPDPCTLETFNAAHLDWDERERPEHAARIALVRQLLAIRASVLTPRLNRLLAGGRHAIVGRSGLRVLWRFQDGTSWILEANLGDGSINMPCQPGSSSVYQSATALVQNGNRLPPWTVRWSATDAPEDRTVASPQRQ